MFLYLLFATFVTALAVSFFVMRLFTKPVDSVLHRIIADEISAAWSKYMKFAILVVGVSAGVQLRDLEKYINPALGGREVQTGSLSFDRWIFEVYRAAIETLQGIAWMLLVFFAFALIAYVIVRIAETRKEQIEKELAHQTSDFTIIQSLSQELEGILKSLDKKVERWAELAEMG